MIIIFINFLVVLREVVLFQEEIRLLSFRGRVSLGYWCFFCQVQVQEYLFWFRFVVGVCTRRCQLVGLVVLFCFFVFRYFIQFWVVWGWEARFLGDLEKKLYSFQEFQSVFYVGLVYFVINELRYGWDFGSFSFLIELWGG